MMGGARTKRALHCAGTHHVFVPKMLKGAPTVRRFIAFCISGWVEWVTKTLDNDAHPL